MLLRREKMGKWKSIFQLENKNFNAPPKPVCRATHLGSWVGARLSKTEPKSAGRYLLPLLVAGMR